MTHSRSLGLVVSVAMMTIGAAAWGQCSLSPLGSLAPPGLAIRDAYGKAVAAQGTTLVIGANDMPPSGGSIGVGYVSIFFRTGASWTFIANVAPTPTVANEFGFAVAIDASTIVVGAPRDDNARGTDAGAAYVFAWNGLSWVQQAQFIPPDGLTNDLFGRAVAISGDTVMVGSYSDVPVPNGGGVYVYTRAGSTWSFQTKITPADISNGDFFGSDSIAIRGGRALISAAGNDVGPALAAGAVYSYVRTGGTGGPWAMEAKMLAPDAAQLDALGTSVAFDGDSAALAGSPSDDLPGAADAGTVYRFTRSGAIWTFDTKLAATDVTQGAGFGTSLFVDGDRVCIGAPTESTPGFTAIWVGAAYEFRRVAGVWSERNRIPNPDPADFEMFGSGVAIIAGEAIIGVPGDDTGAGVDSGSARRYQFPDASVTTNPANVIVNAGASAMFTTSATGVGTLTYHWRRDGVNLSNGGAISGADTPVLTINPSAPGHTGLYDCAVTGPCGGATSAAAILAVRAGAGGSCIADIDGNGSVGLSDVAAIIFNWGATCP